jgi:serine/threonine-protein kinase
LGAVEDLLERLKSALADRYRLERELGRGGMAVVYLAQDLKHDRPVAIKVLKPELAATMGSERFLREIEISARLNHPNILTLIDSGDADGFLYYVMPYVEEESLRDRLDREQQLSVADAVAITCEVADALSHAHSLGVVHRDIKPENILFEAGHAVVADFGIARAVTDAAGERLTETGLSIGTPAYMSPEQAAGARGVNHRTDIYALGCVAYEMLAGSPPFTGGTPQAVLARHMADTVPSLQIVRKTVSPDAEAVIERALSKTPADRFATAAEFARALETSKRAPRPRRAVHWLRAGIAAAAVALLLVLGLPRISNLIRGAAAAEPTWIMVKPFAFLGPEDRAFLADGLVEDVRSRRCRRSGRR